MTPQQAALAALAALDAAPDNPGATVFIKAAHLAALLDQIQTLQDEAADSLSEGAWGNVQTTLGLQPIELRFLRGLFTAPKHFMTRRRWGAICDHEGHADNRRNADVWVCRLRKKLGGRRAIFTAWGEGWQLSDASVTLLEDLMK